MPKRNDIHRILVIGAGPIVIGQAGEFDYSGSQAVKALKNLGYYVVVLNSNPATIMTDPELSDRVYIEPINTDIIEQIIQKEKIDAILPTVGGQTALNVSLELHDKGLIEKYGIELLGVSAESIAKAEHRELFRQSIENIGLESPKGKTVKSLKDAIEFYDEVGLPLIIRPSLTLGGSGGGVANTLDEFKSIVINGLSLSPITEVLVEESLIGWKEYEFEVIRDNNDNAIIVASIENFDPMGVHTGDSITVAPAQTLSDDEYQKLRDYSIAVIREIGVATGGSNIQFALNPQNGDIRVIEMNPRVSRSSALVSKATGFPIAKIAAMLAVGLNLDEITNDITKSTPASFEPVLDYIVVKIPRWDFEKFKSDNSLTTQMKSVGEVMAIGSNFREALQKAYRSLEIGLSGLESEKFNKLSIDEIRAGLGKFTPNLPFFIKSAIINGLNITEISQLSRVDIWFVENIKMICDFEKHLQSVGFEELDEGLLREAKLNGFSDIQIAKLTGTTTENIRQKRIELSVLPTYKKVDTCAAEFEAVTPYYYSTYLTENESEPSDKTKIIVLGGGPFRIGQGLEFDYCASQAAMKLKELDYEVILINCNPETVSTDYDTSNKLYFEPVHIEDVMNIIELEKPYGVVLQLGGQTPLKLSKELMENGVRILGTEQQNIDLAEDRGKLMEILDNLNIEFPPGAMAKNRDEAFVFASKIGYPVIVRPSYVLGGRGMAIVYDEHDLSLFIDEATRVSENNPVLIDKFLENALEADVDAVSDGQDIIIAGIMEHIEEAGIHSGDSCSVLPSYSFSPYVKDRIREITYQIARKLQIKGFINIQFAIADEKIYLIEVNPRASRTVPFVSKSSGIPMNEIAVRVMTGEKIADMNVPKSGFYGHFAVKTPVFSFSKFPGVDTVLGPEMRSTGEVMGISEFFGEAYVKSQIGAGNNLPLGGNVFISVNDHDKKSVVPIAQKLRLLGFEIYATLGTFSTLHVEGVHVNLIHKIGAGHPNVVEMIHSGNIQMIINTPLGRKAYQDDLLIRSAALQNKVLCITNISAARAIADGMEWLQRHKITIHNPFVSRKGN
ncbi:MAG: carbamoyl-phosphate synthase large subunit [Desulfobulbaceae bacterium]|nr:carbamoyl-phosphate synthase large subunit [Candidatus Kapabacteria bacterium]MBS3999929.1 carbamoyl-phosphate synthase large subunit [Desulfobulbaceae bacterium]